MQTPGDILDQNRGLTTEEAAQRLRLEGSNLIPAAGARSQLRIILDILREPMLALLLAGGLAYLLLGSPAEAIVLVCFAGFSIFIAIVQESRTEHVLRALRDLAAPRALVVRDGRPVRVAGREVVTDDLLVLEQGDRVAADAVLLDCQHLAADESLLTGESVPVDKRSLGVGEAIPETPPGGDGSPLIYSATMVTRGRGTARVLATGGRTQVGRIGQSLSTLELEAPGLRRQVGRIVRLAAAAAGVVTLAVTILFGILRGGWLEAVLAGIAIGMSLLPEEFPVVLAVFLAMGAWRISKVGVLTRRAAAIETLGSATILCADKTGTLTVNHMTVTDLWRPDQGAVTVVGGAAGLAEEFVALLETGALASAALPSDPMEMALHDARADRAKAAGEEWRLERTFALSEELLAMSNAWARSGQEGFVVAAKGAPEAIADLCRLKPAERAAMEEAVHDMAERGVRVLGVAEAEVVGPLGARQQDHRFVLRGLIGLSDPLRPGIRSAIERCGSAGIRVMMITGDYPATARAIAAEAGIARGDVLTGAEIAELDEGALRAQLATVTICARTLPAQKLRIVQALKAGGEIVAMTGDGVNDAPAVKAAHIGIAMGGRGTDVAREAASIVLVEDDFATIVAAIALGRRIYDNLRKAMGFIFSAHVPIAGLALMPLLTGLPILFGPIQIALLEMIIDPVCALSFEAEPPERDVMARAPRRANEPLFSARMIVRSLTHGVLALGLLGTLFALAARQGLPAETLRAFVFFALVSSLMALVLVNRAFSRSIADALLRGNPTLRFIAAGIAAVAAVILLSPSVQQLLQFKPLNAGQLALAAATGGLLLFVLELTKRGARRDAH